MASPTRMIADRLRRLPLVQEKVWSAKYLLGSDVVAPHAGRWRRLREWLADLDRVTAGRPAPDRTVLAFASSPLWIDYLLGVSALLAAHGCRIEFVWLPQYDLEPGASEHDRRYEQWSMRFDPPERPRFRAHNLLHTPPTPATPEMEAIARQIADLDTRYLVKRERMDLAADPRAREIFDFRVARNLDCLRRFDGYLRTARFDSALTGHGAIYEMGCVYHWLRARGRKCVTVENAELREYITASYQVPCIETPTDHLWAADEPHVLTPERAARVEARLSVRRDPTRQAGFSWQLQPAAVEAEERLRRELRLDPAKPTAVLCTNLAWDSAVLGRSRTFPSMADWYLATIDWFAARPNWQLVIRTHPVEAYWPSDEQAHEVIQSRYPELPPNVRLIKPADKVNTYGLLPFTDLGLIFCSTIGLEMACQGIPTIVSARVHYERKGFTVEPATPAEYFAAVEEAMRAPGRRLTPRQVELAKCYFDVYMERWPRRFPWRLLEFRDDLRAAPMARLMAGEYPPGVRATIDYLAGRVEDEVEAAG